MSVGAIFSKKYLLYWFYIGGGLLLLASALIWWLVIMMSPERVFNRMLEQSLRTSGATLMSQHDNGGTNVSQYMQFSFGESNLAQTLTILTQSGTVITTEVLGTEQADFTRYKSVESGQTSESGKPLDFSSIVGIWAKADQTQGGGQLIPELILGLGLPLGAVPVPIGSVTEESRARLLSLIRDKQVYKVDFAQARKQSKDNRSIYIYDVALDVQAYAQLMKEFGKSVGLNDLDALDPGAYSSHPPIKLQLAVDVRSSHLVELNLPDSGYRQIFNGYDLAVKTDLPEEFITMRELQNRLQQLQ